ncbi:MAG: signal peptidase I [Actinomycetota bacterium]
MQTVSDDLLGERLSGASAGNGRLHEGQGDADRADSPDTDGHGEPTLPAHIDLRRPALEVAAKALADDVIDLAASRSTDLLEQARATAAALLEAAEQQARELTQAADESVAAAEARLADLLEVTASVEEVGAEAAAIRARAEEAATEILDRAWETASQLQEEMLREAEEHVRDVLRRAEASSPPSSALRSPAQPDHQPPDSHPDLTSAPDQLPFAAPSRRLLRSVLRRLPRPRRALMIALPLVLGLLAVRAFLFAPYSVSSTSMEPTLADGDRVLVNKVDYRASQPRRGDIVLIEAPPGWAIGDELVKRVVAVGGDTVEAADGHLRVNGVAPDESYLPVGAGTADFDPIEVPDGYVFVLGDNRSESVDSRAFGPIPEGTVTARVDAVIWPLADARML